MSRFFRSSDSWSSSSDDDAEAREHIMLAAVQGKRVPGQGALQEYMVWRATIHGIRYNEALTRLSELETACLERYDLAQASNARLIMSNEIPKIHQPEVKPYCIWHTQVACEPTHRNLAFRYPDVRYQVGRGTGAAERAGILVTTKNWVYCLMSQLQRRLGITEPQVRKFSLVL